MTIYQHALNKIFCELEYLVSSKKYSLYFAYSSANENYSLKNQSMAISIRRWFSLLAYNGAILENNWEFWTKTADHTKNHCLKIQ